MNPGSANRLLGVLLLLLTSAALPQDPVLKTRPKEHNSALRVTLNVQVTDHAGNPVSDLRAENFTLLDNHQPSEILAFHPIDGAAQNDATEVLILLDAVNTPAQALDQEKTAIFKYLAESRKPLPFPTAFALWFNGHLNATPASTDRNAIGRAFVKLTKNVHSNVCETEQNHAPQRLAGRKEKENGSVDPATCRAVHFKDSVAALDGIAKQQLATGGRTLLMWMGSGWPEIPSAELEHLESRQREAYSHEFVQILHDLQAAQMTVYLIAPENRAALEAGPNPDAKTGASNTQAISSSLRVSAAEFALRTGGRVLSSSEDLLKDLHACIRDAEWYYALSFNAPPAQRPGELHLLEVKVNRPGLEVRTMNSY